MSEPPAEREGPKTHRCRCLLIQGLRTNRCPAWLSIDQPLCGTCEDEHLTGADPIFEYGAYMMLVPPGFP